jgi:hypothetical protein
MEMGACVNNESDEPEDLWRERLKLAVSSYGGTTAVSRLTGIPPQTLRNHLSGRTKKAPLEDLRKVSDALGLSPSWMMALDSAGKAAGFAEGDAAVYDGGIPPLEMRVPYKRGRWLIRNRVLDLCGFLPGDIVEFDLEEMQPPRGTVVVDRSGDRPSADRARTARCRHGRISSPLPRARW